VATPAARLKQHALDDARVDVARFEVLEGGHRVAALLHQDAVVDNCTLVLVEACIEWSGNPEIAWVHRSVLIHRDSYS
jgi:hypothetical protein